jgi:hypothetical protein
MKENETKPISTLVLIEDGREIKVEKSIEELKKEMFDSSPILTLQDINGLWYLLPKMVIKMIVAEKS